VPRQPFADFLFTSFAALEQELPAIYAEMCRILSPRVVAIAVDDEHIRVRFDAATVRLLAGSGPAVIEVQTTRAEILALVDAEATLVGSVVGDRLLLKGTATDLLAFHDGLLTYLHGAVRAPSFPQLLRRFRWASPLEPYQVQEQA